MSVFFSPSVSLIQLAIVLGLILWIYCLIDILKSEFNNNDKLIWLLAVILLPVIGSFLYFFIGRYKKI